MINTLLGLVIDPDTMRPVLGGVTGGLSGPAIRPVALRCVWQVHQALPEVPILGMGGIRTRPGRPPVRARRCVGGLRRDGGLQRPVRGRPGARRAGRRAGRARASPRCRGRRVRAPMSAPLRRAARRRRRRPRTAVRGHRPARAAAGEVGPVRRRRRPGPVHRRGRRRARRLRRRPEAAAGLLRAARLARAGRPGGRRRRGRGPPVRWCCSTPSAATSARRWTPTATTCGPTTRSPSTR